VSQKIIGQFSSQATDEFPHECCGFLIGNFNDGQVDAVEYVNAKNTMSENKERRFIIDPIEYMKVESSADAQNMSLIGIVHSHPNSPAVPSEFDRDHAFPGFSYIIISVMEGDVKDFRSWRLTEDREKFIEEYIDIQS
jgi:proteasome lid subunit RPN8/RPN11